MGMYDSIFVHCPFCGEEHELQSKAGECNIDHYALDEAPPAIMGDLAGSTFTCGGCHRNLQVEVRMMARVVAADRE